MKRRNGFSLIEMMASLAILVTVVGLAITALMQAQNATSGVALQANTQENLRAGMHFIVRDLMQAGEGIPPEGVSIPYTAAGVSNVNWPGTGGTFPTTSILLSAITPGSQLGQAATSVNPKTGAVSTGAKTDTITIIYADDTLVDSSVVGSTIHLNSSPIVQAAPAVPVCAGTINATGLSVTLAAGCFKMPGAPVPIAVGNLIMFTNQNGTALEYVTSVAGQTINFAAGDPAKLNATGLSTGTVADLQNAGGSFPPTTITRVWMITYYIDTVTNPSKPQLIRQVNYPNYPAASPANPPQLIADVIEDLGFTYDITSSTAPAGTYPLGAGDAPTPVAPDTPSQIRAVNIFLAGRSEYTYSASGTPQFFRNNMSTQVSLRSAAFVNQFNISSTAPQQ